MLAFSQKKVSKIPTVIYFELCTFKQDIVEEDRTLLFTRFKVKPLTTLRLISNEIWREAIPNPPGS